MSGASCGTIWPGDCELTDEYILVAGNGEASAAPDVAVLSVGVEVTEKTVADARQRAAEAAGAVLDAIRAKGVAEKDIRTTGLQLHPQYDYSRNNAPKIIGYVASHQLSVKVRAMENLSGVVDGAVVAGGDAARLQGISFEIDDATELLAAARRNAIADARLRAETYAEAAGVSVGKVLAISEAEEREPAPRMMMAARAESMKMADTPIQPGESTIAVRVSVRFALG